MVLMEKVRNIQKHMGNISREETVRIKMLEIYNIEKEMKNAFDELTSGLSTAKERIRELEGMSIEPSWGE